MSNQAAWLDGKGHKLRIDTAELPTPGANEIVIKNHAIAINPIDWMIQDMGVLVQKWPFIPGNDVAGEVYDVGSEVKNFRKGDRVIAHTTAIAANDNQAAGFQLYTRARANGASLIPESLSFDNAVVLPLAISTAAHGLYDKREKGLLGLEYPSLVPKPSGKTILVWGGASSVGSVTIQLAIASGAKVVAIASKHNHEFVKKLGASEAIDYNSPSVVDDAVKAIRSVGGEFYGIFDAIAKEGSYKYVLPIAQKFGDTNIAVTLSPPEKVPEGIKFGQVYALAWDSIAPVWEKYVPEALEQGKLQAVPEPLVVGRGLGYVEKAVDTNRVGVSAKKVIVQLI